MNISLVKSNGMIAVTSAVNFGLMGLSGIALSTTTALISSIAIGIGIDYAIHFIERYKEYAASKGDKVLAWSVFLWNAVWGFGSFLTIVIWNYLDPWPPQWWAHWFFITHIIVTAVVGLVTTVWFTIGTTWDLTRMFRRLKEKDANIRDDGRVVGHVSVGDIEMVEKIEHRRVTEDSEDPDEAE